MVEIGAYVLNRWRVQGRPEDGVVLADCLRLLGVMVPGEWGLPTHLPIRSCMASHLCYE